MAKKKAKKWIQKADIKKGALTDKAKKAGYSSWESYCNADIERSATTEKQCNLARTFKKMRKKK